MPGAPSMVVRNMPGAGSMAAANYIFNNAPKDGSQFATFSRSIPTQPLFDKTGVQFDALKLNWIGSPASEVSVVFSPVYKSSAPRRSARAVNGRACKRTGADSAVYPFVINALLGTKMKVVTVIRAPGLHARHRTRRGRWHGRFLNQHASLHAPRNG